MTKLVNGIPSSIKTDNELNGVITTADVLAPKPKHRITGVYFVPYYALDNYTGYPKTNYTMSPDNLITFLQTNEQVFKLKSYNIRNRKTGYLSQNNNINSSVPQFFKNENIVFCDLIKNYKYTESLDIEFPMIDGNKINIKSKDNYFAAGYPICIHYSTKMYESIESYGWKDNNIELIKNLKLAPFVITKNYQGKVEFKNGKIINYTVNAQGMKGGALFRIRSNLSGLPTIEIFGCIFKSKLHQERGHCSIGFY